jgi:hypothetical protein
MRSTFGINDVAPAGLLVSWRCHFIGLHTMLAYYALSGHTLGQFHYNPARYVSEVVKSLAIKSSTL